VEYRLALPALEARPLHCSAAMRRTSLAVFVLLLVAAAACIVNTTGQLPARIASHFGSDHRANGWMTREFYRWFMFAFATLLPGVIVAAIATLPRILTRTRNLSPRMSHEVFARSDAAIATLADHAPWLGCLLSAFIVGVHYTIVDANAIPPRALPDNAFLALMAAFLGLLAVWVFTLWARLRQPH